MPYSITSSTKILTFTIARFLFISWHPLFVQMRALHCDIIKQARLADTCIFNSTFLSVVLKLNV